MFLKFTDDGFAKPLEGVALKPLAHGEHSQLMRFHFTCGSELPMHSHPNEQTGFLVSGEMVLRIGDAEHHVLPGDSWCIPKDVVHGARIIKDAVAVEMFTPVREDYLPENLK